MISGIQAALSGLQAYSLRVQGNANNVANLNSEGFKRDRVLLSEQLPQGVATTVEKVNSPGPVVAEQTTNGLEMIEQSNVDLSQEMPELMLNSRSFSANLKTLQATDEMTRSLLDIKA